MNKIMQSTEEIKQVFIGLEDSKSTYRICARYRGMEAATATMPAAYPHLQRYLEGHFPDYRVTVLYEAGFKGFELHDQLVADGYRCVVTPPNKVTQAKDNRVKTDSRDARRLAKILETGDYVACHVPDRGRREDREISRSLEQVASDIRRTKNRIRGFLKFHGLENYDSKLHWTDQEYRDLRNLDLSHSLAFSLEVKLSELEHLWELQLLLRCELKRLCQLERYQESVRIKMSFPGIGWLTAIRLTLEWGDLSRFPDGKHLASFSGLTCREYSTGDTIHRGRITGQSAEFIRSWLIEIAWRAIRKDPVLFEKFQRVWRNSGSKKKAIVAVARKLVVRMRAVELERASYRLGLVA